MNIGDDLDFDDDSIIDNAERRDEKQIRSKSILISVDDISFSCDNESDGNFSILDENNIAESASFKLERILDVDLSPSSISLSCTESTKNGSRQKQERRRAIKVDEVLWSNGNKDCPTT